MHLVNEATTYTQEQEEIDQLVKVLLRIITAISEAPEDDGPFPPSKIDMKYVFWRILC